MSGVMPLLGLLAGIAAVLAVVVTSLFIGVCLAVARITDAVQAARGRPQRGVHGGGGAGTAMLPSAGSGRRDAPGVPVASWRGDR